MYKEYLKNQHSGDAKVVLENDETDISVIRHADNPIFKERIMSQLFGEFVSFLKEKGLVEGQEFETAVKEIFQSTTKIIWIDRLDNDFQLTVVLRSIEFSLELGFVKKEKDGQPKEVLHRNKLENLRYNISPGSRLELIDSHLEKYKEFFEDFKKHFAKLKPNYVA
jgi:hypothetical protein